MAARAARAGGEELGGIRGVKHFMQRTALQGSPALLTKIVHQQLPGAPTRTGAAHPFRLRFGELEPGYGMTTPLRQVTLDDIEHFAHFTGDTFYAHMDEEAAAKSPIFGGRVAHGYLILSFAAGLFVDPAPGPVLANYGLEELRFVKPLKPGREHSSSADRQVEESENRGHGRGALDGEGHGRKGRVGRDLRPADDERRLSVCPESLLQRLPPGGARERLSLDTATSRTETEGARPIGRSPAHKA